MSAAAPWQDYLALSRRMIVAGEAGCWSEVARLEQARRSLLPGLGPVPGDLAGPLAEADRRLLALGRAARSAAAREAAALHQAHAVRRAYRRHGAER